MEINHWHGITRRSTLNLMPCSLELLISHDTMFFSHNKTVSADLSTVETISRTRCKWKLLDHFATQVCITTLLPLTHTHTHTGGWRRGAQSAHSRTQVEWGCWTAWLQLAISSYTGIQKMYKSTRGHAAHYQEPCFHCLVLIYLLHTLCTIVFLIQ
jgi:hypothetical protein